MRSNRRALSLFVVFALAFGTGAAATEASEPPTVVKINQLADEAEALRGNRAGEAADRIYQAMSMCVALRLDSADPAVKRIALLYVRIVNPNLMSSLTFPRALATALDRSAQSDDDASLFLLRYAWALDDHIVLSGDSDGAAVAYDLAQLLAKRELLSEAKSVIAAALKSKYLMDHREGWGIRLMGAAIQWKERDPAARSTALTLQREILAYPSAPSDFREAYWLHRVLRFLVTVDTGACNVVTLTSDLRSLLESEEKTADALLMSSTETRFRSVLLELGAEDEIFAPIVQCGFHNAEIVRLAIDRLFLLHQMWRYRASLLYVARSVADGAPLTDTMRSDLENSRQLRNSKTTPEMSELLSRAPAPTPDTVRQDLRDQIRALHNLRQLQTQFRLRVPDASLVKEIATIDIPSSLSRPDDVPDELNAMVQIDYVVESIERELAQSCGPSAIAAWHSERSWTHVLRSIGKDGALIGYVPVVLASGGRNLIAFIVDGDGQVTWTSVGDEEQIARKLDGTLVRIVDVQADDIRESLRRAAQYLFDPIAAQLVGKRRIRILSDSRVRFFPWAALVDKDGAYLGDRFHISWIQSVRDLDSTPELKTTSVQALLVAPAYETTDVRRHVLGRSQRVVQGDFTPLRNARQEIGVVQQVLYAKGIASSVLEGASATEGAFRRALHSPAILHIASHGFRIPKETKLFGEEVAANSAAYLYWPNRIQGLLGPNLTRVGLALAGANRGGTLREDDGLLVGSEVADLDLRGTSLVVLSACLSAEPQIEDVGGAYDLSLAFRIAGANAVVGSLWPVDDRATSLLMKEFYQHVSTGEAFEEALWHATQAVRRQPQFADPYFWAAFEVFGNGAATLNNVVRANSH